MTTDTARDNLLAPLAVLGSITSLCIGSSYAKSLFSLLGAQGVTAYRVGIAIEFTGPLTLSVIMSRRPLDFVWIGLAALGLVLLLPLQQNAAKLDPTGIVFILAAALCWALYIGFGKRAGSAHAGQVTSLGMSTAALVVVPFGIATAGTRLLSPQTLLPGLAVAALSSAIPYSLEMFALKRLPKQTFGILLSMEPAVGALAGWLVLGEHLVAFQLAAIALIIAASIGSTATIQRDNVPQVAETDPLAP